MGSINSARTNALSKSVQMTSLPWVMATTNMNQMELQMMIGHAPLLGDPCGHSNDACTS